MKLYHYSVETFQNGDDELIGDYKQQYKVYEPYILCLQKIEICLMSCCTWRDIIRYVQKTKVTGCFHTG